MTKWFVLFFAVACAGATLASACTPSANVHTAMAPGAPFAQYQTFSFGPSEGAPDRYKPSTRSVEVQRRMRPLVVGELEKKGYVLIDGNAGKKGDVVIELASGQRERETHPPPRGHLSELEEDENQDYVEGSLVVDIFDGSDGGHVFHGSAHADINPDKIDDQRLQTAVAKVLAQFPPRRAPVTTSTTSAAPASP